MACSGVRRPPQWRCDRGTQGSGGGDAAAMWSGVTEGRVVERWWRRRCGRARGARRRMRGPGRGGGAGLRRQYRRESRARRASVRRLLPHVPSYVKCYHGGLRALPLQRARPA